MIDTIKSNVSRILFGSKSYSHIQKWLHEKQPTTIFILVDAHTQRYCLPRFIEENKDFQSAEIIVMNAGESFKNIETCTHIWKTLSEKGADRRSLLINLGGGVVTDLGGFVACTFKRGIDFINIPTTLLAMVDASVGGKTGVDFENLKNQIGIIQEPKYVLIDSQWLDTLAVREIKSGFAEMLKHGLIADPAHWQKLSAISIDEEKNNIDFIHHSVSIKNSIVLKDPFEENIRKYLNFGHTLGHAIESFFLSSPQKAPLLHGEAIAIGMILEAYLSNVYCGLPMREVHSIKEVLAKTFAKVTFSIKDITGVLDFLKHDKKNKGGQINYVLLEAIGKPRIDVKVAEEHCHQAFEYYNK